MPKVSVIIPTYNRAELLKEALNSVFAQTFQDYEVIVVDDGSTDNTKDVVSFYRDKVKYYYKTNGGPASARNMGIINSAARYLAFIDSDDLWLPQRLELGVSRLEAKIDTALVFSDMKYIVNGVVSDNNTYFKRYLPARGEVLERLCLQDFIPTSTVILKKECLCETGYFDEALRVCEDYDLWLRIASRYKVEYIDQPLACYRYHEGNLVKTNRDDLLLATRDVLCQAKKRWQIGFKSNVNRRIALLSWQIAKNKISRKQYLQAISELGLCLNYYLRRSI